ncbi:MAG: DegT/DnrJ/EryC1/StrS family aminotransferase [Candidatus Zixiibacteriota bacterium]
MAGKLKIRLYDLKVSTKTINEVTRTLQSGWLTSGPKVALFEKAIARYAGVPYAAAVSSGTIGIMMALKLIGVQQGKEVVTTPFSFVATTEVILNCGARPVFADIDRRTLNIDPDQVSRKVNRNTACILPVDIAGYPADYEGLNEICDRFKVPLIADACHSFGAKYKRRSIPRVTDAAVFSFHATKNLTCGEGGMVLSRHREFMRSLKTMSLHGMTAGAYVRRQKKRWEYDVVNLGMKGNMSDIHAAVGLGQLEQFDLNQLKRRKIAERYIENLKPYADFLELPPEEKSVQSAWHLFIIKLRLTPLKISRDTFIREMAVRGVECGVHYKPIYELDFYRKLGQTAELFPETAYVWKRVVTLPMYPGLKLAEVDFICDAVERVLKKFRK